MDLKRVISAKESDAIWAGILELAVKYDRPPETIARIAKARARAQDNGTA